MKDIIKKIIRPLIPQSVLNGLNKQMSDEDIQQWKKNGSPGAAPHIVKQMTIKEYQKNYGLNVLIETGTYLGDMVEAQKATFNKVISIELGVDLWRKAQKRFNSDKNVTIVNGDSGKVLPEVLKSINEPAIFWLDGHYSAGITAKGDKDCPIYEEVDAILATKYNHILLIDDARLFNGGGDYPTNQKLTEYIKSKNPNYNVEIKDDIIRYTIL